MKKFLSIILILGICFSICACDANSSNSNSGITQTQAISNAKKGAYTHLASVLGFDEDYLDGYYPLAPSYDSCIAVEISGGAWRVELKGVVTGITTDHKKIRTYDFFITVKVTSDGSVQWFTASTDYKLITDINA